MKRISPSESILEMDEVLFQIPELIDYSVRITEGKKEITALFTSDNGKEQIRKVYPDGDIFSLNCKKAEWTDKALYPAKRVILRQSG